MPTDWRAEVRRRLDRHPALLRYRHWVMSLRGTLGLHQLTPEQFIRSAYNMLLRREPSAQEIANARAEVVDDGLPREFYLQRVRASEEFMVGTPFEAPLLLQSLHTSRSRFITSLPKGRRILDLGGTHRVYDEGPMVTLGYPYDFDELTIIDLPSDDRHELYQSARRDRVQSRHGLVTYRYHSMTDLSAFDDNSIDLVYSGQSIEHVTPSDADVVIKEVARVLRPGGSFALDTPNARVCRLQQDDLIDPDHEIEYTHAEITRKLRDGGLEVVSQWGLNYCGRGLANGEFDWAEAAANTGLFAEIEDCYLLGYVARKP